MKRNMGLADRIIRSGIAAAVAVLYFTHQLSTTAAIVLGALAVVFLATSFVGVCPLYLPFRFSTARKSST